MTPRAELAEAVCRKAWADLAEGGTACPGCGNRYDLPVHAPTCPLAAWHAAAEAPRGWTVRRRCGGCPEDGWQRLADWGCGLGVSCNRLDAIVFATRQHAKATRRAAVPLFGDGWRVCKVWPKKDGG